MLHRPSEVLLSGNPVADIATLAAALRHQARLAGVHVTPGGNAEDVLDTIRVDVGAYAAALTQALEDDRTNEAEAAQAERHNVNARAFARINNREIAA